ncbi:hypothetical protein AVEN_183418-1, partial [Araneus ventricosus]
INYHLSDTKLMNLDIPHLGVLIIADSLAMDEESYELIPLHLQKGIFHSFYLMMKPSGRIIYGSQPDSIEDLSCADCGAAISLL